MIVVEQIRANKKQFLPLLLLADEQESMVDLYLERGEMFVLRDGDLKAICVVTKESEGVCELKNLATVPQYQRQGYGRSLINFLFQHYQESCHTMFVGTGDTPHTLEFYKQCGFVESHRVFDFFLNHYDQPIIEGGKQLIDMVYLKKVWA